MTMRTIVGLTKEDWWMVFVLTLCTFSWLVNIGKLAECDFKADFKCELVHGLGVVGPPLAVATVWVGVDK